MRDLPCGERRIYLDVEVRRVLCRSCGKVKQERLEWLAKTPFFTKRFYLWVGRRCRTMTISDVAQETHLDWKTIKALDKQYMEEQVRRAGSPAPKIIGIDELSLRKGHRYRIIVSDMVRQKPIWYGGEDRSEASMDQFFDCLGEKKSRGIRLAVMDMWKPFRNSCAARAPQAALLYDKFHAMRHLGEALDEVRRSEYARLTGDDRKYIKGQRYALLAHRESVNDHQYGAKAGSPNGAIR